MAFSQVQQENDADLIDLKNRMKLIEEADPTQYQNEFALRRYLRAFKTADDAFKVNNCSYAVKHDLFRIPFFFRQY